MNPQSYQPVIVQSSGAATASLVLGVVSALLCWIPFLGLFALLGALVGLATGYVGLRETGHGMHGHGQAVTGMALSAVAVIVSAAFHLIIFVALATG